MRRFAARAAAIACSAVCAALLATGAVGGGFGLFAAFSDDGDSAPAVSAAGAAGAAGFAEVVAAVAPGAVEVAWAAPNAESEPVPTGVPTDDTGMVDETQKGDDQTSQGGEGQSVAETPLDPNAAPSTPAEGTEESATDAEGTPPEDKPAKAPKRVVPDAVFSNAKDANNLVNPQQKPDSSFIYDTSISDLQSADSYLNDQTVQVTGEVVGDRLWAEFDPGYCWVVLQSNDGNYAEVPVFLTEELSNLIDTYGSYGRKGTTLQVRGTFHLACPQHEGLTDLHAGNVSVVAKGVVSDRTLNPSSFIPGAVLVGVGLVLTLVFHRMREGQR